jgi:hypothetical protein
LNNLSLLLPLKNADYRLPPRYFYGVLLSICLAYFGVEVYYITHSIFSVDDFWLAYHTYHFKSALPYRDFSPYKTVLGYYLMLLPMLVTHGTVATLLAVKMFLALINTLCLALTGCWLKRIFSPTAALFALAMLVSAFCFLAFSPEIRVDLLAYWLCLFSLLFVFEEKWLAAGFSIGVALLISQKASWSLLAMDCALLASGGTRMLRPFFKVNGMMLVLLGLYILLWSGVAGISTVLKSIFYEAYLIANLSDYQSAIADFWKTTVARNLFLFLSGGFGLLCLLLPPQRLPRAPRVFIITYAVIMAAFFFTYQQPFAYHLLVVMPALLLLSVVLCDWVFAVFTQPPARWVFALSLIAGNMSFASATYLFIAQDNHYQRNMLGLAEQLLQDPEENYVAGVPLIYSKASIIPGLTHLTVPQLKYLYQPDIANRKLMLESLYLSATSQSEVLSAIRDAPIKFYINNNRMQALPPALKNFLAQEYQHFWGSIYLYAPTVPAGEQGLVLKFGGYYKVKAADVVAIDGKFYPPGTIATLHPGNHLSVANSSYRLQLVPEIAAQYLDFKLVKDMSGLMLS